MAKTLFLLVVCGSLAARAQDSRLGTYRAERVFAGGANTPSEVNRLTVKIFDVQNNVRSTITKPIAYDVGPAAVGVFESGSCVLLDAFHGVLEFYDRNGRLIHSAAPLKDAGPELERVMPFAVHDSSLAVAISEPEGSGIQLLRFTERGELVSATELSGTLATAVVESNSGSATAVGTTRWTGAEFAETIYLVSFNGTLEGTFSASCSFGAFGDGDSLLLVATAKEISLLSRREGTVRSREQVGAGRIALDVAAEDGRFVVLTAASPVLSEGHWRYEDLRVESIGGDGKRLALPREDARSFESARLRKVNGDLLLEIDGALRPIP